MPITKAQITVPYVYPYFLNDGDTFIPPENITDIPHPQINQIREIESDRPYFVQALGFNYKYWLNLYYADDNKLASLLRIDDVNAQTDQEYYKKIEWLKIIIEFDERDLNEHEVILHNHILNTFEGLKIKLPVGITTRWEWVKIEQKCYRYEKTELIDNVEKVVLCLDANFEAELFKQYFD